MTDRCEVLMRIHMPNSHSEFQGPLGGQRDEEPKWAFFSSAKKCGSRSVWKSLCESDIFAVDDDGSGKAQRTKTYAWSTGRQVDHAQNYRKRWRKREVDFSSTDTADRRKNVKKWLFGRSAKRCPQSIANKAFGEGPKTPKGRGRGNRDKKSKKKWCRGCGKNNEKRWLIFKIVSANDVGFLLT